MFVWNFTRLHPVTQVYWPNLFTFSVAPDVFLAQEIIHTGPGLQELMECVFRSNPPVEVVWTHNDRPIDFEERSNLRLDTNMQARHEIISVLQINNLKDEDLGTYRCEGGNQIAIATEEIYISGRRIYFIPRLGDIQSFRAWGLVSITD